MRNTCGSVFIPVRVLPVLLVSLLVQPAVGQHPTLIQSELSRVGASDLVAEFYRARAYESAWLRRGSVTVAAFDAITFLDKAAAHGLNSERYDARGIRGVLEAWPPRDGKGALDQVRFDQAQARLEVRITRAVFALAADIASGAVDPTRGDPSWHIPRRMVDIGSIVETAMMAKGAVANLDRKLAPASPEYVAFQRELAGLNDEEKESNEHRRRQILVNLERLRWLTDNNAESYVYVNVARCSAEFVRAGASSVRMRVVVGATGMQTPSVDAMITHVVVAPYWNVPGSIAHNEIWPHALRDPDYLQRNNMIVTRAGTIRQNPGPTNPLGRVKFKMPNEYGIALHDTPDQSHFEQSPCAFSHGCVRIQNAMKLASLLLLDNPEWSEQELETVASEWRETEVPLTIPVPVRVAYMTNWLDAAGIVQYGADFYSRDIPLFEALDAKQNALAERTN